MAILQHDRNREIKERLPKETIDFLEQLKKTLPAENKPQHLYQDLKTTKNGKTA